MRIALIYTGHLRTWRQCAANHRDCVNSSDADFFWHVYDDMPDVDKKHYTRIPGEYWALDGHSHPYDQNRRPETSVANTLNQWHNNFIGFCLVPKVYDVYVRIRPDITFSGKINFHSYDYSGNKIYIPHGHNYYGAVNDQIAWGNYEVMKAYYSIYLNHHKIFADGIRFHTETYVTENLKRHNIEIIRVPIDNYVIR